MLKSLYFVMSCAVLVAAPAKAQQLDILVGVEKPPYIKITTQTGYELELLRAVTKRMGYDSHFIHVPNGRLLELFNEGVADLVSLQRSAQLGLYATDPYISYQSILIVRQDLEKRVEGLSDLVGLRVMAYHNARQYLPPEYAAAINKSSSYLEVVEQHQLPVLLLKNRVDALVMDSNVFRYYYHQTAPSDNSLKVINLFKKNRYHMLARSPETAKLFNKALAEVKESGEFHELQLKYFSQLTQ